jgi:NADPH:quinone reductase-like Zn-dependent oxidoreductase
MMKAVRFKEYGGPEVLEVVEVETPSPDAGEVLVKVKAAGINPSEAGIRGGALHDLFPAHFPEGEGSDFAGIVEAVGSGVSDYAAGDEVIGYSNARSSHAEFVCVDATQLTPKPANVSWEVAGALFVAGATAYAEVNAIVAKPGDTVVVSAAAGGVSVIAIQLLTRNGVKVIGLASKKHHDWLEEHGAIGVEYGDGVAERIRDASGGSVDAFLDNFGGGYIELALELGVPKDKINSIADFPGVQKHGVKAEGNAAGTSNIVLAELAALIADDELEIPIAASYPLADVRSAYEELEKRHTRGKIVLIP